MTGRTVVESSLFASVDPPRLAGSRCANCATVTFPVQTGCPKCAGTDLATIELPATGTLWTWTIQSFEPKVPYRVPATGFANYGVGYVDLGELIVETRIEGDLERLRIGAPMQIRLLDLWSDDAGEPVATYAFEEVTA